MAGVDCYGLVSLIMKNEYGLEVPDWHLDRIDLRGRDTVIAEVVASGDFEEREPMDGDVAICSRTKAAYHIGMYFARGVIHCVDGVGAVYVPRSRFERDYVNVTYGAWTP